MSAGAVSDFGIYVHWPICAAKCPYCDFNSHVRASFSEARWSAGILRELGAIAEAQTTRPEVVSVFFGGGTPSLMSGQAVAAVLDGIARLWPVADKVEVTLEANPNSVEQQRFRDYRAAGVNRVSIGVQSLRDEALRFLGRLHGAEEARTAIRLAVEIFPRSSFDLIYARPGQSPAEWRAELTEALAYGNEHLSLYQLTIEQGTAFASLARQGKLAIPEEDAAADLYDLTQELSEAAGLPAYEVSNHARAGAESRHNLIYWRYGDYAGAGPGAHGRLSLGGKRWSTQAERLPEKWLARVEEAGSSLAWAEIDPASAAQEHLLMALRLSEGLDLASYEARWGTAPAASAIARLSQHGLVSLHEHRLTATPQGRLVLNGVIAELAA
jgi:putative oxygen-independent coproporphyrinogen III oxidase